jgi:uncharacterized membrane protein
MTEEEKKELHEIARNVGLYPKTTTIGLGERPEGVLCYSLWFISGIIFLIMEKDNKFIRFHALQSIATFLPLYIFVSEIEKIISMPTIGFSMNFFTLSIAAIVLSVIWILIAILWLLLMYKASRGEKYKLPIVGRIAERYA